MKKPTIKQVRASLKAAQDRLQDVKTRGDAAINKYDLRMGYDANFYLNVCPLLQNHVNYFERQLQELTKNGEQLGMF